MDYGEAYRDGLSAAHDALHELVEACETEAQRRPDLAPGLVAMARCYRRAQDRIIKERLTTIPNTAR